MCQRSIFNTTILLIVSLLSTTLSIAGDCPANGGHLSLLDGSAHRYVCKQNDSRTLVHLKHSELATEKYVYVITNQEEKILGYSEDRSVDLSDAPRGTYHVWGVSYAGKPQRPVDILLAEAQFSDDCFSLSENFVRIVYADLVAQQISSDNEEYISITESTSSLLNFQTANNSENEFMYVVTNYRRRVVGLTKDQFNFKDFGTGEYRVYGYSYTGDFNIKPGDFMMGAISAGCYEKSANYITVNKLVPAGFHSAATPENPLANTDAIMVDKGSDDLAYQTAEMSAEAALTFDQEAADMDQLMINKLSNKLATTCNAYAGHLIPDKNQLFYNQENMTVSATITEAAITDYYSEVQYLLVNEKSSTIDAISLLPTFMIGKAGTYHIYPMVVNFQHKEVKGYFDNNKISLGKTTLEGLRQQLASSDICSDLPGSPATIVVTTTGDRCAANAGTMQATETILDLVSTEVILTATHLETPVVPAGYKKTYLLTWLNQIVETSDTPTFAVDIEGSYGIICLVSKNANNVNDVDGINLQEVKKAIGSSIFQLIEYIDNKGICASVSSWNLTEVIPVNSLSFSQSTDRSIQVIGR